jgi:hypothetical protein
MTRIFKMAMRKIRINSMIKKPYLSLSWHFKSINLQQAFTIIVFGLSTIVCSARSIQQPATGTFNFKVKVLVADTQNISSVVINLGSAPGLSDIISGFKFSYANGNPALPAGYTYSRKANKISLTIGSYPNKVPLWGTYSIIGKDGSTVISTNKFMYK